MASQTATQRFPHSALLTANHASTASTTYSLLAKSTPETQHVRSVGRSEAPPWARHYQTQAQVNGPPDPKLPKHHTIPPYIFQPGMEGPVQNQFAMEAIRDLERRIMQEPNQTHTAESLTTLYWAWWRSLTPEDKKLQAGSACPELPKAERHSRNPAAANL